MQDTHDATSHIACTRIRSGGLVLGFDLDPEHQLEWILSWSADDRLGLPRGTVSRWCDEDEFPGERYPQYRSEEGLGGLFAPPLVWWVRIADVDEFVRKCQRELAELEPGGLLTRADLAVLEQRRERLPAGHSWNKPFSEVAA